MDDVHTLERWRSRLPHWEVDEHWHFVTIRSAGSLPASVKCKLVEIRQSLDAIDSNSPEFSRLQRQFFLTIEKYVDLGEGFALFREARACERCLDALTAMENDGWLVGETVVMLNHLHLLIRRKVSSYSLREVLIRFKGRSSHSINREIVRSGKLWQQDWFDRWMRYDAECRKVIEYIRYSRISRGTFYEL